MFLISFMFLIPLKVITSPWHNFCTKLLLFKKTPKHKNCSFNTTVAKLLWRHIPPQLPCFMLSSASLLCLTVVVVIAYNLKSKVSKLNAGHVMKSWHPKTGTPTTPNTAHPPSPNLGIFTNLCHLPATPLKS